MFDTDTSSFTVHMSDDKNHNIKQDTHETNKINSLQLKDKCWNRTKPYIRDFFVTEFTGMRIYCFWPSIIVIVILVIVVILKLTHVLG